MTYFHQGEHEARNPGQRGLPKGAPMRVLVLTSCTGEKAVRHEKALTLKDFEQGPAHISARESELSHLLTPAQDLYTGLQHTRLMRGVRALRDQQSPDNLPPTVDLWLVSAGYGLVPGDRKLAPYECTFQGMRAQAMRRRAEQLNLPIEIRQLLAEPYDLGLVLLGEDYLHACALDQAVPLGGFTLLLCGGRVAVRLPRLPNLRPVVLTKAEARRFSCPLVGLKGEIAARLLALGARHPRALDQIRYPRTDVLCLLTGAQAVHDPSQPTTRIT
jgi:hypothetical protein